MILMGTDHKARRLPALACAGYVLLAVVICSGYMLFGAFDDDEFQHVHFSWLIRHGSTPYVDFFEHHSPAYHLMLSPLAWLGSGRRLIFLYRTASVMSLLGALALTYLLCRRETGRNLPALFGVTALLTVPMFLVKMIEARPASPALLCMAAALYLVFGFEPGSKRARRRVFFAGILTGLMILLSPKYAFTAAGLLLAAGIVHGGTSVGYFLVGMVASAIPLFLWLCGRGAMGGFIESVALLSLKWKRHFPAAGYLVEGFLSAGPLIAVGIAGFLSMICLRARRRRAIAYVSVLAGSIAGIFISPIPFRQMYLPVWPMFAVGAAWLLRELFDSDADRAGLRVGIGVLLVAFVAPGIATFSRLYSHSNVEDLQLMQRVEEIDPSGGPVFDGRGLMFYRPHVGRHACMHEGILMMLDAGEYSRSVLSALGEAGLPTVIADYRVDQMPEGVRDFIARRYRPDALDVRVMVPGVSIDRAQLAGGPAVMKIEVTGTYQANWQGPGVVLIDGLALSNGGELQMGAGKHAVEASGFIMGCEITLKRRE
jgi:MFS family permease